MDPQDAPCNQADDFLLLQQSSITPLHAAMAAIRAAGTGEDFKQAASDIRRTISELWALGLRARPLTELFSRLTDLLTQRLVEVSAQAHGLNLSKACWLAFGSEGRSEPTLASDQDNGLIFESDDPPLDRPAWLAMAREVNDHLAACGFPLCTGGVMAQNAACCLTPSEWLQRFEHWIEQGSSQDVLAASVYFDLRPVAGQLSMAEPLQAFIARRASANPRFCRQMAEQVLRNPGGLGWWGHIETQRIDDVPLFDLKMQGTAVFVAVARLHSLALGIREVNTRKRLEAIARLKAIPDHEARAWVSGFEFLQGLRWRMHVRAHDPCTPHAGANHIRLDELDDIETRTLKATLHVVHQLLQQVEIEYARL